MILLRCSWALCFVDLLCLFSSAGYMDFEFVVIVVGDSSQGSIKYGYDKLNDPIHRPLYVITSQLLAVLAQYLMRISF